jgi:hypothetical protein
VQHGDGSVRIGVERAESGRQLGGRGTVNSSLRGSTAVTPVAPLSPR